MSDQLKKGALEIAILGFLNKDEMYGYQVVQVLDKYLRVKESSVYLILSRLFQNGYLDVRIEHQGKKQLKYYKLSAAGIEYLNTQLESWNVITNLIEESRN